MAAATLKYGYSVRIMNSYGGAKKGGYLGIGSASNTDGALDDIGTYQSKDGNNFDITQWTITVPTGSLKKNGNDVTSGDLIYLVNKVDKGYLGLFNTVPPAATGYPVATAPNSTDDSITVGWYVFIKTPNAGNDPKLTDQVEIYLMAAFGALSGVLDTNGAGYNAPFLFLATGARLLNRDGASGLWTMVTVS